MDDRPSPARTLAEMEGAMASHYSEVLHRATKIHNQIADAAESGCSSWTFVPEDEPPVADTLEAVEAFREFRPTIWWRRPDTDA